MKKRIITVVGKDSIGITFRRNGNKVWNRY